MKSIFMKSMIIKFMKQRSHCFTGLICCLLLTIPETGHSQGRVKKPDQPRAVTLIINKTNEFRKTEKFLEVKIDKKLTATAQDFADFMARTEKYGHEADGNTPAGRAKAHKYELCVVAENIAWRSDPRGFSTGQLATGFYEGWKESPTHRKNMLDPDVTETGVAIAYNQTSGKYYSVQLFGKPASGIIEFRLTNNTTQPIPYKLNGKQLMLPPRFFRSHSECRQPTLAFSLKGDEEKTTKPDNQDHFEFDVGENGALTVERGKLPANP